MISQKTYVEVKSYLLSENVFFHLTSLFSFLNSLKKKHTHLYIVSMRAMDTSMNHQVTRRAARRRRDTTNQPNITTISARREVTRRDHIIMTMPDISMKMDMKNIMVTRKNTERKVCYSLSIIRFDVNAIKVFFFFFIPFYFSFIFLSYYILCFYAGGSDHHKKWGHKKGKGH